MFPRESRRRAGIRSVVAPYVYNSVFGNDNPIDDVEEINFEDKLIMGEPARYMMLKLDEAAYVTIWIAGVEVLMPRSITAGDWYDIREDAMERIRIKLTTASSANLQLYASWIAPAGAKRGVRKMR